MSTQTEPQQNSKAEALHMYGSYPFATDETYQVDTLNLLSHQIFMAMMFASKVSLVS